MWRGWSLHKRAVANTASPTLSAAVRSSSRPIDPDRSPSWRPPERRWLSREKRRKARLSIGAPTGAGGVDVLEKIPLRPQSELRTNGANEGFRALAGGRLCESV